MKQRVGLRAATGSCSAAPEGRERQVTQEKVRHQEERHCASSTESAQPAFLQAGLSYRQLCSAERAVGGSSVQEAVPGAKSLQDRG